MKRKIVTFRAKEEAPSALIVERKIITVEDAFYFLISGHQKKVIIHLKKYFKLFEEFVTFDFLGEKKIKLDSLVLPHISENTDKIFFKEFLKAIEETFNILEEIEVVKGNDFFGENKKQYQRFKNNRYKKEFPFKFEGYIYNEDRENKNRNKRRI